MTRFETLAYSWREKARVIRPLESARITATKRARIAEWMFYTNRANELETAIAAQRAAQASLLDDIQAWLDHGSDDDAESVRSAVTLLRRVSTHLRGGS